MDGNLTRLHPGQNGLDRMRRDGVTLRDFGALIARVGCKNRRLLPRWRPQHGDRYEMLLSPDYRMCAVLQTWTQREMLSSYLLLRSGVDRGLLAASPEF